MTGHVQKIKGTKLDRLKEYFRWFYRILAVLINNLYCIPTYVVWCMLLHPIYFLDQDLFWKIEGQFFQWLLTMVAYWSYSAGYYIVESGDKIEHLIGEETLVLVNHQSTSDVPLLMYAFSARNGLLQNLNWIMDAVFQYTNFGVVSTLHGDFFINAGRARRDASLRDLENFLKTRFVPRKRKWLVLFPEGGFLRKRKEASKRYAEKMKLPNLEFVTLPRMGALQTIIDTLCGRSGNDPRRGAGDGARRGQLKYIIDMTIAYPNGEPLDLGAVITGYADPCKIRMHYKIYPMHTVPFNDPEMLQTWLYNLYIEKNGVLARYYETGSWNPDCFGTDINNSYLEKKDIPKAKDGTIISSSDISSDIDVVDKAPVIPSEPILSHSVMGEENEKSVENHNEEVCFSQNTTETQSCPSTNSSDDEITECIGRTLHLDLLRIFILHVMFISSTCFHVVVGRAVIQLAFGG